MSYLWWWTILTSWSEILISTPRSPTPCRHLDRAVWWTWVEDIRRRCEGKRRCHGAARSWRPTLNLLWSLQGPDYRRRRCGHHRTCASLFFLICLKVNKIELKSYIQYKELKSCGLKYLYDLDLAGSFLDILIYVVSTNTFWILPLPFCSSLATKIPIDLVPHVPDNRKIWTNSSWCSRESSSNGRHWKSQYPELTVAFPRLRPLDTCWRSPNFHLHFQFCNLPCTELQPQASLPSWRSQRSICE